jgi:hypothetical protein
MAVVKTNPLPNGLYWIDLFSPSSSSPTTKDGPPIFFAWVNSNKGRVTVRRTEEFPEPALGGPRRTWIMFEVLAPPGAFPFGLGYPNSTTNPDEPSFYSELPTSPDFGEWLQGGSNMIVALALLYILSQWKKG